MIEWFNRYGVTCATFVAAILQGADNGILRSNPICATPRSLLAEIRVSELFEIYFKPSGCLQDYLTYLEGMYHKFSMLEDYNTFYAFFIRTNIGVLTRARLLTVNLLSKINPTQHDGTYHRILSMYASLGFSANQIFNIRLRYDELVNINNYRAECERDGTNFENHPVIKFMKHLSSLDKKTTSTCLFTEGHTLGGLSPVLKK